MYQGRSSLIELLPGIWNQTACVGTYKAQFMSLLNMVYGVLSGSCRLPTEPEDAS